MKNPRRHRRKKSSLKKEKPEKPNQSNQIKKMNREIEAIENEIESLELEKNKVEESMADPDIYANPDKLSEVNSRYNEVKNKINKKNLEWETLVEQLDSLK
jgi:ATP-binding cassette subfamily F protein 3